MDWQTGVSILSVSITSILGIVTLTRGTSADKALNIATNVQSTFNAQGSLIEDLRQEIIRVRALHNECEADKENMKVLIANHEQRIKELES